MRYNVHFLGKWVVYTTIVGDNNFMSIHNRTGLSDEKAKGYFQNQHVREVKELQRQKRVREAN